MSDTDRVPQNWPFPTYKGIPLVHVSEEPVDFFVRDHPAAEVAAQEPDGLF